MDGGGGHGYNATLSQHGPKAPWELLINKTNNLRSGKKQVHSSTFHINTIFCVFTYYGPFRDTVSQTKGLINLTQAELWLGLKRPWASQEQWKPVMDCFVSAPISSLYLHHMLLKWVNANNLCHTHFLSNNHGIKVKRKHLLFFSFLNSKCLLAKYKCYYIVPNCKPHSGDTSHFTLTFDQKNMISLT